MSAQGVSGGDGVQPLGPGARTVRVILGPEDWLDVAVSAAGVIQINSVLSVQV